MDNFFSTELNVHQFYLNNIAIVSNVVTPNIRSSHYAGGIVGNRNTLDNIVYSTNNSISITDRSILDINSWKAYLGAQYNAGIPIKVQYQLATPVITNLSYTEIRTYYPQTNISTTDLLQPNITAKCRVIEI